MAILSDAKYEADDGKIYPIRLNADTLAAAGAEPAGGVTENVRVKVSKTNREFGIAPRKVILSRTAGAAPDNFRVYASLPVLTAAAFNSPAFTVGASITLGGEVYVIIGKRGEDY